jgi:phosphatidylglycerophosphatase A
MKFDPRNYDFSSLLVNAKNIKIKPPKFTWYTIIVTWFWVGFLPVAQGTFGSLAVYPIFNFVIESAHSTREVGALKDVVFKFWFWFWLTFVLGWLAIIKFQEVTNTRDHKMIVIDEVIGMLFALALCFDWAYIVASKINHWFGLTPRNMAFFMVFVLFRFYDIAKPFFISTIDANYKKPLGVILDDVAAGGFTAGTIYIVYKIMTYVS